MAGRARRAGPGDARPLRHHHDDAVRPRRRPCRALRGPRPRRRSPAPRGIGMTRPPIPDVPGGGDLGPVDVPSLTGARGVRPARRGTRCRRAGRRRGPLPLPARPRAPVARRAGPPHHRIAIHCDTARRLAAAGAPHPRRPGTGWTAAARTTRSRPTVPTRAGAASPARRSRGFRRRSRTRPAASLRRSQGPCRSRRGPRSPSRSRVPAAGEEALWD